jgi:hypothetical protein
LPDLSVGWPKNGMKRKERQKQGVRVGLYIPRALLSPEELSKARAHDNQLARERRRRDPEAVRAWERAKRARRIARDREGFLRLRVPLLGSLEAGLWSSRVPSLPSRFGLGYGLRLKTLAETLAETKRAYFWRGSLFHAEPTIAITPPPGRPCDGRESKTVVGQKEVGLKRK